LGIKTLVCHAQTHPEGAANTWHVLAYPPQAASLGMYCECLLLPGTNILNQIGVPAGKQSFLTLEQ